MKWMKGPLLSLILLTLLLLIDLKEDPSFLSALTGLKVETSMQEHRFPTLGFRIQFPSSFYVTQAPHVGGEITYTVLAQGEEGIRMMVQGWRMRDIKGFIETSLISAPSIDAVSLIPYSAGGYSGYFLAYRQHLDEKRRVYIREVFLRTDKTQVTRFSLIMEEKALSEAWEDRFFQVVSSYKKE